MTHTYSLQGFSEGHGSLLSIIKQAILWYCRAKQSHSKA